MTSALATHPAHAPPVTSAATLYWRASGLALAAVALLGVLLNAVGRPALLGAGFLAFDWTHNVLHLALAALALGLGFGGAAPALSKGLAKAVGGVYVLLGLAGFAGGVVAALHAALGLHLEVGENLVHLALGAWALYAGFASG